MLQKNKIKAHKIKFFQLQFHSGDEQRRLWFCEWGLYIISQDPIIVDKLNITNESTFIRNGQAIRHLTYH